MNYPTITDRLPMRALVVNDELTDQTSAGRAIRALIADLRSRDVDVIESLSADDAQSIVQSDASIQCMLLDWDLHSDSEHKGKRLSPAVSCFARA